MARTVRRRRAVILIVVGMCGALTETTSAFAIPPRNAAARSRTSCSVVPTDPLIPPLDDNDQNVNDEGGFFDIVDSNDEEAEEGFVRDEADRLEELEDRFYVDEKGLQRKIERCILVGVEDVTALRHRIREQQERNGAAVGEPPYFTLEESMMEMRELIKTAGLDLVGEITQRLHEVNPKTYVGSGKVEEAKELLEELASCTVVFDAELTPGQQKALENAFNKKVIQNDFLVQEGEIKVM